MDKILVLRYQNVKASTLFSDSSVAVADLSRENTLIKSIKENSSFTLYYSEYKFLFYIEDDLGCFGTLMKKQKANVGRTYDNKGPVVEQMDNWQQMPFYIYYKTQIIFIQEKKKIIPITILCELLSSLKIDEQKINYYNTIVEPIIEPGNFWPAIKNSDGIYGLKFELVGPNLFGATKSANQLLQALKPIYNQEKFSFSLENENAALKVPENKFIETCRDQAESGGGSWQITALIRRAKIVIKSYDKAKTISTDNIKDIESLVGIRSKLHDAISRIDAILLGKINKSAKK
ncbi:hypothetical protein [Hymenobacter elongatus]|uniref:DUF4747 family protein n=1 Tax=Hymenobacter elongatus TaxID=877208 RepID=A0A4Z0PMI9_9BACT|nr:hypothetical protein [Hymenobacter elongatus]TGE17802.1 hypothetical protein E5J99_06310 [Hymenobacter elongatus]